jgi:Xaa-Pro aminopeptidase
MEPGGGPPARAQTLLRTGARFLRRWRGPRMVLGRCMDAHRTRREAVFAAISPGVAVFPAAPVAIRNNDVEHEYRQDSDLFYLTGFDEPEAVAVLWSDGKTRKLVLFCRTRDRERETWDGLRAGLEGAKERHGADEAYPIAELSQRLPELMRNQRRLYYRLGRDRAFDDRVLAALELVRARGKAGSGYPTEIVDPATVVHELRRLKGDDELRLMRRAADITIEGHLAAMRSASPGKHEYELEAVLREAFRRGGAERCAYQPIVGSGRSATILHYRTNNNQMADGDLVLIDAGCEYGYYAADVTRTFPVGGAFTAPQRAVYEAVLRAQEASLALVRAGNTLEAVHQASVEVLVDALVRLDVLRGDRARLIEDGSYRKYYMHKTSHYLGMDVHDVGSYFDDQRPRPLEPGVVVTVEPGLYFSDGDQAVPAELRGIGVRIEDDVLVTAGAPEVLTAALPRTVADVERACRA